MATWVPVEARRRLRRVEVLRADQHSHLEVLVEAADGSERQHPVAAELAGRSDVGAVIDQVGRDRAIEAVPGDADDVAAVGRLDRQRTAHVQLHSLALHGIGALGQAVAVDHAQPLAAGPGSAHARTLVGAISDRTPRPLRSSYL